MRTTLILLRSQELRARTGQCKTLIKSRLRFNSAHPMVIQFYSTAHGTLRDIDTHRIHVYLNGRVTHGKPWNSWGTISWSWNSSECNIRKSMGQSWYKWYNFTCMSQDPQFSIAPAAKSGMAIRSILGVGRPPWNNPCRRAVSWVQPNVTMIQTRSFNVLTIQVSKTGPITWMLWVFLVGTFNLLANNYQHHQYS